MNEINLKQEIITAFINLDANNLEKLLCDDRTYSGVSKELFIKRFREYFEEIKDSPEALLGLKPIEVFAITVIRNKKVCHLSIPMGNVVLI